MHRATRSSRRSSPKAVLPAVRGTWTLGVPGSATSERLRSRAKGTPSVHAETVAGAAQTLEETAAYLRSVTAAAAGTTEPADVFDAIQKLERLRRLERPLRLLQARLLRDLRATRALDALGYTRVRDFVEQRLGVSERTARNLVATANLFEDVPALKEWYERGDISLAKAHAVKALTYGRGIEPHCRRARELTHRQFEREVRFQRHLRECLPHLAARFRGPLPQPGLDAALIRDLCKEGWTRAKIGGELRKRGVEAIQQGASRDPAENPVVMHRLEVLLDLLISEHYDDPPTDRQTFGRPPKTIRIRFWAPYETAADWKVAIEIIRRRIDPFLPEWKAAMILFAYVHEQWMLEDPETKPTQYRILKRDRFQCQAPGCPRRDSLEVHHMEYLSQGGPNTADNKVPLCHGHHQHSVHPGYARVSGKAPQSIRWELGCRPNEEPLLILRGERIVGGSSA
jgi:hypothetical protein